jgi:hypothetical protein
VTGPLTIGEIFDRAVVVAVSRRRALLVLSAISVVPAAIAEAAVAQVRWPVSAALPSLLVSITLNVIGITAMVHLVAYPETTLREAFRASCRAYWRMLRVNLLSTGLLGLIVACAGALLIGAFRAAFGIGGLPTALLGAVLLGVPVTWLACTYATPMFLAYATAVLDGTGARESIAVTWRRVFAAGDRRRTMLLGAAIAVVSFAPAVALDPSFARLAQATGQSWIAVVEPVLTGMVSLAYGTTVATVAAVDYRVRADGADIVALIETAAAS